MDGTDSLSCTILRKIAKVCHKARIQAWMCHLPLYNCGDRGCHTAGTDLATLKGHGHDVRVRIFSVYVINLTDGLVFLAPCTMYMYFWPRLPNLRTHISVRKHRYRGPLTWWMYSRELHKSIFKLNFQYSDWSSNGVDTEVDEDGNVVCISTHLTSFAVLVDVNGPEVSSTSPIYP